jgi:hypothetical protein
MGPVLDWELLEVEEKGRKYRIKPNSQKRKKRENIQ